RGRVGNSCDRCPHAPAKHRRPDSPPPKTTVGLHSIDLGADRRDHPKPTSRTQSSTTPKRPPPKANAARSPWRIPVARSSPMMDISGSPAAFVQLLSKIHHGYGLRFGKMLTAVVRRPAPSAGEFEITVHS